MPLQRTLQECRFGTDPDPRGIPVTTCHPINIRWQAGGEVEAGAGAKSGGSQ
jgi:hypothetical protein